MKKIFTLIFAVGFITAVNAQTGTRDARDNKQYSQRNDQQSGQWDNNSRDISRNDSRFGTDDHFNSYGRGMEMQVAKINRKYDFQIQRVKNDFFMGRFEKMRRIRSLDEQRQQEISMLYHGYNSNRNLDYDRGHDSNHRY